MKLKRTATRILVRTLDVLTALLNLIGIIALGLATVAIALLTPTDWSAHLNPGALLLLAPALYGAGRGIEDLVELLTGLKAYLSDRTNTTPGTEMEQPSNPARADSAA